MIPTTLLRRVMVTDSPCSTHFKTVDVACFNSRIFVVFNVSHHVSHETRVQVLSSCCFPNSGTDSENSPCLLLARRALLRKPRHAAFRYLDADRA